MYMCDITLRRYVVSDCVKWFNVQFLFQTSVYDKEIYTDTFNY